jgi:diguanylate cyclase (GGDEF)-like protein
VLGTVLVPLLLLTVVSVGLTVERQQDLDDAREVARSMEQLDTLLELRSAMFAERLAEEVSLPGRRPPDELLERTGFGTRIAQEPQSFAVSTDAAFDAVPERVRPFTRADLDELRSRRPSSADSPALIASRWDQLHGRLESRVAEELSGVRATAVRLAEPELELAAGSLENAIAVPDRAARVISSLSDLWLAPPSDRPVDQSALAAADARFSELSDELAQSSEAPLRRLWGADDLGQPAGMVVAVDQALQGSLTQPDRPVGDPAAVGLALLDGIDWLVEVNAVPLVATDVVGREATAVAVAAQQVVRAAAASTLVAIVASIVAALLFGRSIVAPVRRLVDQATRVGGGELEVEPLELAGPPEVIRASAAFNDVVDNLVLLERKTHALAECDFDDPALDQPLPGLLGASLQRSVRVLSGSIVERQELQLRLVHQANHDALTGLANRAALVALLREAHDAPDPLGLQVAVIFVDLDGFKRANDRYGHAVGDEVLRIVARRMRDLVGDDGMVARLGGDEFVVVLRSVQDWHAPVALARQLVTAVFEPIEVDDHWVRVGASAGVALAGSTPSRRGGPLDVLRRADLAVYAAKQRSGGAVSLYDDEMDRLVVDQEDTEDGLADALESEGGELSLVYQPILDARSGRLRTCEALVRWHRPGRGEVPPGVFVPIAERSGLVVELDLWVLATALGQLQTWSGTDTLDEVGISVNVSGRSLLEPSFVDEFHELVAAAEVSPSLLTVEITETALVTDLELAASQLEQLRRLGVRVAIDDFGTGYTSVAHLRALPVDEIKIDSSFVQGLPERESHVLVQMINELAHRLDVPTVAEGVETAEQAAELRAIGCDALQGFHFARPMEPQGLSSWWSAQVRGAAGTGPGSVPASTGAPSPAPTTASAPTVTGAATTEPPVSPDQQSAAPHR